MRGVGRRTSDFEGLILKLAERGGAERRGTTNDTNGHEWEMKGGFGQDYEDGQDFWREAERGSHEGSMTRRWEGNVEL
jgi:hypothetical protein